MIRTVQADPGDAGASSPALASALEPAAAAAGLSFSLSLHIVCQMRSSAMKSGRGQRILSQTSRSLCWLRRSGVLLSIYSLLIVQSSPVKVQGTRFDQETFLSDSERCGRADSCFGEFLRPVDVLRCPSGLGVHSLDTLECFLIGQAASRGRPG